jgi:hypothetical protein
MYIKVWHFRYPVIYIVLQATIMQSVLNQFLQHLQDATQSNILYRLVLGNRRDREATLKNVYVRLIELKGDSHLSLLYRHERQDITKNFSLSGGMEQVKVLLEQSFYNAELFTKQHTWQLAIHPSGKVKLHQTAAAAGMEVAATHNKEKNRLISAAGNIYLKELGITTAQGEVKKDKQDKYKQINHYTELLSHIVKEANWQGTIKAVDMGSGKGYLTFALYDYLNNILQQPAQITGIEMRPDLVATCTTVAAKAGFTGLQFVESSIAEADITGTNLLIALHACDTATDDAIAKGIAAKCKIIVCAPCCHKQIRKQMAPQFPISEITRHGVFMERQAEMVTDTIRALLLEMQGYKTKVFEFIATAHTPKNVLIAAVYHGIDQQHQKACVNKITALKTLYGIRQHYLEKLLENPIG